jgi:hypothetical protein
MRTYLNLSDLIILIFCEKYKFSLLLCIFLLAPFTSIPGTDFLALRALRNHCLPYDRCQFYNLHSASASSLSLHLVFVRFLTYVDFRTRFLDSRPSPDSEGLRHLFFVPYPFACLPWITLVIRIRKTPILIKVTALSKKSKAVRVTGRGG